VEGVPAGAAEPAGERGGCLGGGGVAGEALKLITFVEYNKYETWF
jgi:hypothetical protein